MPRILPPGCGANVSTEWRCVTSITWAAYDGDRMTTDDAETRTGDPDPNMPNRSSPIDWLDLRRVPGLATAPGRLGMTGLAGVRSLRRQDRVDKLVLLVEDSELAAVGVPGIADSLAGEGIAVIRHPIADMGVPADGTVFRMVLDVVRDDVFGGLTVVVACFGGFGRTGTAVACLLVDAGLAGDAAITLVRATRPGTIETRSQEAFVRAWVAAKT